MAKFARKTVPASRATLLINELISVETSNVSLMVQFANVTDYDHLAVFVRHGNKTDLQTNEFDAHFLIDVSSELIDDDNISNSSLFASYGLSVLSWLVK